MDVGTISRCVRKRGVRESWELYYSVGGQCNYVQWRNTISL